MTDDGWKGGQDSQAYVDHLKAEVMTDARDIVDQAKLDWAIVPRKIIDGEPFVHAELAGAWANQYADTLLTENASLRKQLEDAREALRQWWCRGCNGTGQIGVMVNGEYRSEKHHHCDGVGLEPIAHEALKGKS